MSDSENYREAKRLVGRAHHFTYGDGGDPVAGGALATEALAHAVLALVDSLTQPQPEEKDTREGESTPEQDPVSLRWGLNDVLWGDDDTVTVLMSGPNSEPFWLELEPTQAAVLRDDLADPDGPVVFQATWDTEQCGPLYGHEAAARARCEHDARVDHPDGTELAWRAFEENVAELVAVVDGQEQPTGYTVTRLPLASEYDEEAGE